MSLRIFILEDDSAFFKIVQIRLKSWRDDLTITRAENIAAGRRTLDEQEPFDLAIFDQHLPDGRSSELLAHPKLEFTATLAVSSDTSPDMPASTVIAGAQHFLGKRQVTEALFLPLVAALVQRAQLERELAEAKLKQLQLSTVKTLVATLQHEINNPLGAMFGGAYLIKNMGDLSDDQRDALRVIESSSERIRQVIKRLCETVELEQVKKGADDVFHIPGDAPWIKS